MHIYIHTYIYRHIHTQRKIYVLNCIGNAGTLVGIDGEGDEDLENTKLVSLNSYAFLHISLEAYVRIYICVYMDTYMQVSLYIQVYTYTYTHIEI
jgi:hypothetical protein